MPLACIYFSVATLDGQIYVTGTGGSGNDVILFDPASGAWSSLAPTMHNREQASLFVLGGCVHVAGGTQDTKNSVERYDASTDTWTAVANMLKGRRLFGAVTISAAEPAEDQNLFDALIAKATQ
jgi:N-acetylneuraminic acid mutarotase